MAKESVIAQLVESFPSDASDEDFVKSLAVYQSKELRTACSRLQLHPQAIPATNNKEGYIELLRQYRHQHPKDVAAAKAAEESIHGRFRLANVIFGDVLIERMAEMYDANSKYWQHVSYEFRTKSPRYGSFVATREVYADVRPTDIPELPPYKLEKRWKEMQALYTTAKVKFDQSGTNEEDFFVFCEGRLDVLYVHDWLKLKPEYGLLVEGKLPLHCGDCRAKRAAEVSQNDANAKRRREASKTLEERMLAVLNQDREAATKESAVRQAADFARAIHNGMQVVRDMKEAGVDVAVIELVQQKLNSLMVKWLNMIDKAAMTT